jgi:3-hydroxy-D-aspartate aldolase
VFAREGIKDILITNQITDLFKINRLTNISKADIKIACCVDDEQNIININNSAKENNTTIDLFIEFDCGANRCGIQSHKEIEKLILLINSLNFVNFLGFQAYNGSIQHIEDFVIRKKEVVKTCDKIKVLKNTFKKFSPIITGVGTGCFDLEVSQNIYDEIQVGSYAFMDAHYSSLKHDNKLNNTNNFENSLFILSSVMSKALDKHAVVDAGLKSVSVDSGLPKVNTNDINYIKCSDEHGIIHDPKNSLKINDKLYLIPGHCDPTCNLHDWYVVIKNEIVMDLWPVSARGYSY